MKSFLHKNIDYDHAHNRAIESSKRLIKFHSNPKKQSPTSSNIREHAQIKNKNYKVKKISLPHQNNQRGQVQKIW
jgi:hypothetical protein